MKKEDIFKDITQATKSLLDMAKGMCFNYISDNCLYIISEIKDSEDSFQEQFQTKIKENSKKKPKPLSEIIPLLENLYPDFYDVNLYIYRAGKDSTIVEIQYYPRHSLEKDYQKQVELKDTMLHCKVATPSYYYDAKEKFDIHWQFGTLNHKWKRFWWRIKESKKYNRN